MASLWCNSSASADGDGSYADPWNVINPHLRDLDPADTLYLRGGSTAGTRTSYTETLAITSGNGACDGSAGNVITLTNAADEYVKLTSASSTELITIEQDYWTIEGQSFNVASGSPYFELDRAGVNDYAVRIGAFSSNADNNTLKYLHIHNGDYNPALVRIRNSSNNLISYCRIHDNAPDPGVDHHGVYISSNDAGTPADDNIIEYCHIYDVAGDCVQIQIASDGTISGVIVRYCTMTAHSTTGASEAAVADKNGDGTIVHDCIISGMRDCDGSVGGTGADGRALVLQSGTQNGQLYDNEIYDISGAAFAISGDNSVVRHNLVRDLVNEAAISEQSTIYIISGTNISVHNNTIAGSYAASTNWYRSLAGTSTDFKNNIVYNGADYQIAGSTTYSHNCWYNTNQTLSGANDVTSDPLFSDAGNDDYTLQTSPTPSPCIDAGSDLGYSYNGTAPDMGAFESASAAAASVIAHLVVLGGHMVMAGGHMVVGP